MHILRPTFPSPILCIDEFLLAEDAQRVLQECIDLKKVYAPARVFDGPNATKIDQKYRKNEVVYLDDVFRTAPERSDILTIMKRKIWTDECRSLWHEGYYIFDVINYSTWQEAVISRYGDGQFYDKHQDTRRDQITYRLVTILYYVNTVPQSFTGGSLLLWHGDENIRVEPQHNRAVVFPSFTFHQVEEVRMNNERWEDGRFSLNYWIGFR
jgi:predicted 2-oxoglutarate/Fe(II)-dependent dioxygenase YbiX